MTGNLFERSFDICACFPDAAFYFISIETDCQPQSFVTRSFFFICTFVDTATILCIEVAIRSLFSILSENDIFTGIFTWVVCGGVYHLFISKQKKKANQMCSLL